MIGINFVLTDRDSGDKVTVAADTGDVYVWEKVSRGAKTVSHLIENRSMVDLYEIAHIAAKRHRVFDGSLDDFARTYVLEDVDELEALTGADPTQPGA